MSIWCILLLVMGVVLLLILAYGVYEIRWRMWVKSIIRMPSARPDERVVSLTFDDGPSAPTSEVLDVLHAEGVQAAFFCIGERAAARPDLVERMRREGHIVGNHTLTHSGGFPLFSVHRMLTEINTCSAVLGGDVRYFRPPFGVTNPTLRRALRRTGLQSVGWSIRSFDTRGESPEVIVDRIMRRVHNGAIILLHDRMPFAPSTTRLLLLRLRSAGYTCRRFDM